MLTRSASVDANATVCPFFRLSPELRKRIYELVLGVGGIHIDAKGTVGGICVASKSDKNPAAENPDRISVDVEESWGRRHSECTRYSDAFVDLSLLRVSKQTKPTAITVNINLIKWFSHVKGTDEEGAVTYVS